MTYATIEETYTFKKVTFYSVKLENQPYSEIEQFILRFQQDKKHKDELENILALFKSWATKKGQCHFFLETNRKHKHCRLNGI